MRIYTKILLLLLAGTCVLGTVFFAHAHEKTDAAIVENAGEMDRVTRFLLLGCDRSSGLTDSILLISINETAHRVGILQIPRDTYAEYTQRDYKKLNGAMSSLGVQEMKEFLSGALGVPIHYFVVLKLDCFNELVDAVGGVDIDVPQKMEYSDPEQGLEISLEAGPQHLDGETAEHFVRYRAGYVNADLGRLDAQKLFLRAFAQKCKSLTAVQFLRVAGVALTGVQTDVGIVDAFRVANALRECDPDEVPMQTLAGQAVRGRSGAWYYALNREGACRMVNELAEVEIPLEIGEFDPKGLFDREQNSDFHNIYIASEAALPITEENP